MRGTELERQRAFWEFKAAAGYPAAEGDPEPIPGILDELQASGLNLSTAEILDVGCGTGRYTLPLARATRGHVVGLDLSAAMLRRMEASAREQELTNVEAVCAPWESIDPEAHGWRARFDLVFASMTPALNSSRGLESFRACSRGWCAVIGWGRYRRNPLFEEIYHVLGFPHIVPAGIPALQARLADAGIAASARWQDDRWAWKGPVDQALEDVLWNLQLGGHLPPDQPSLGAIRARVHATLVVRSTAGEIHHETAMERGWITWREPSHP